MNSQLANSNSRNALFILGSTEGIAIVCTVIAGLSGAGVAQAFLLKISITAAIAWAITMGIAAYFTHRKIKDVCIMAFAYLTGGFLAILPQFQLFSGNNKFLITVIITLLFLLVVGYWKGRVFGQGKWPEALRLTLSALAASGTAYAIGYLFFGT